MLPGETQSVYAQPCPSPSLKGILSKYQSPIIFPHFDQLDPFFFKSRMTGGNCFPISLLLLAFLPSNFVLLFVGSSSSSSSTAYYCWWVAGRWIGFEGVSQSWKKKEREKELLWYTDLLWVLPCVLLTRRRRWQSGPSLLHLLVSLSFSRARFELFNWDTKGCGTWQSTWPNATKNFRPNETNGERLPVVINKQQQQTEWIGGLPDHQNIRYQHNAWMGKVMEEDIIQSLFHTHLCVSSWAL